MRHHHHQTVQVSLTSDQLAVVDMYRQGVKLRTGRLPTRAIAIRGLIDAAANDTPLEPLVTYAEISAGLREYAARLDALETAVASLLDAAGAKGGSDA